MCCSWDGTVAYFEFTVDEIGEPMTLEEKVRSLEVLFSGFWLIVFSDTIAYASI